MTTKKIKQKEEILKQVQHDKGKAKDEIATGSKDPSQWRIHEIATSDAYASSLAKGRGKSTQWRMCAMADGCTTARLRFLQPWQSQGN